MGILSRISQILKANINDILDKAEDPEKMLEQILMDMREQLREAKVQVARAIADEKKMERAYLENQAQSEDWEKKAVYALQKGDEELAKEALKRKNSSSQLAKDYKTQWESQKQTVETLKTSLSQLESKIEEANRKKNLLIARKKRAEAQKKIQETMAGISDSSAFDSFDRMAAKVEDMEAQAQAAVEMSRDSLEDKFAALEADAGVDAELAALKAKLGMPEKPQIESQ
ncbi:MAG: PspA/IM30 family protein [bacterium]